MKKILLGLGTLASTVAPVAAVVACGNETSDKSPYELTMKADASVATQLNIVVKLKNYVSDSYIREIKSRIVEDIAAANKDALKYSTIHIEFQDAADATKKEGLLISTNPLTDANKNDLDAIHTFMDTSFDTLITSAKANNDLHKFFVEPTTAGAETTLPTFTAEEQDKIALNIGRILHMPAITTKGLFKFAVTRFDKNAAQMEMKLTRTSVAGVTDLVAINHESTGDALSMLEGEELIITIAFDMNNMRFNSISFTLQNSKDARKNGSYNTGGTTSEWKIILLTLIEKITPLKSSIIFDEANVENILPSISTSSAQSFFYWSNINVGGKQVFTSEGGKFTYQISMEKKTFDLKVDISVWGHKAIYGEDGHSIHNSGSLRTDKSTISFHFTGTFTLKDSSNPATYTFTKKEATIIEEGHNDQTVTLNETGSNEMTDHLMSRIFEYGVT